MVARNLAFNMDHIMNCKLDVAAYVEHNTIANMHADFHYAAGPPYNISQDVKCSVVDLLVENDGATPAHGDGCYLGYNIISNVPRLISAADKRQTATNTFVTDVTTAVAFNQNIVDQIADTAIGANHPGGIFNAAYGINLQAAPLFIDPSTKNYGLQAGSPARSTGPGGMDIGWTCPEWAYILGAPSGQTAATTATLTVGGPGLIDLLAAIEPLNGRRRTILAVALGALVLVCRRPRWPRFSAPRQAASPGLIMHVARELRLAGFVLGWHIGGIALDATGNIYAAVDRLQKPYIVAFDSNGTYLRSWQAGNGTGGIYRIPLTIGPTG